MCLYVKLHAFVHFNFNAKPGFHVEVRLIFLTGSHRFHICTFHAFVHFNFNSKPGFQVDMRGNTFNFDPKPGFNQLSEMFHAFVHL